MDFLVEKGGCAAAPMLIDDWSRVDDPKIGLASTWSERHAAFAAGLGTFSLNDGFITSGGIAHRVGSVVTNMFVKPSGRPFRDHRENCLTCRDLECGVCVKRCPVGAISLEKGHDKALCREYTYGPVFREIGIKFGVEHVGCGLCQTDVPCESGIPDGEIEVQRDKDRPKRKAQNSVHCFEPFFVIFWADARFFYPCVIDKVGPQAR